MLRMRSVYELDSPFLISDEAIFDFISSSYLARPHCVLCASTALSLYLICHTLVGEGGQSVPWE